MIVSNNNFIQIFKEWSEANQFINDFGDGPLSDWGNSRQLNYPVMWVVNQPSSGVISNRSITPVDTFTIIFVDQINLQKNTQNENGDNSDNRRHIMSDTKQLVYDFINDCILSFQAYKIIVEPNFSLEPIEDETTDKVNGWSLTVSFRSPYLNCTIPSIVPPSVCQPAYISNSDGSFEIDVPSGMQTVLDDITITVGGGAVINKPAAIDVNLSDYFYVAFPTGIRTPQTIPIQNPNTQVAWLDLDKATTGLGTITQSTGNYVYSRGSFSIPTLGDFRLEGRPRKGTSTFDATGYQTSFGWSSTFVKDLTNLDFNIYSYIASPGVTLIGVRENGITVLGTTINTSEPMLKIERIGIQVRFYVNNTLVWTSYYPSSDPLSRGYAMGGVIQTFQGNVTEDIKVTYL